MEYEELKNIVATQVCAQCGGELTIRTNPETGNLEIWCPHHPDHHGYVERETYTQAMRRGEDIHPAIRDRIEKKMILPGGQPVEVALSMIQTRFPRADMDEPSAALFLWDCVRLDLDPLLGEIFPVSFKTTAKDGTKKIVVQPLISEDGWLSLAARACPDEWAGPPRTMRLEEYLQTQDAYKEKPYTEVKEIAKEIKADLCKDPEAYVWVAVGHRKDQDDVATYGWYKTSESKKKDRDGKEYELSTPARDLPGNQARVRAIKRWVRETFPEAKAKMKEITAAWMERAKDVKEVQQIIEAEYRVIIEPEHEGDKKTSKVAGEKAGVATPTQQPKARAQAKKPETAPSTEPIIEEQEGLSIDLTWLKESLNAIKWAGDTCKTFLVSQYRVSPAGTLEDVIKRLTREQAQEFVNEINSRVEKQQQALL